MTSLFSDDKNRVTLPICDGEHTSDYVNASFIKVISLKPPSGKVMYTSVSIK